MLFDLRARGRRRTVQAVYLALALLFAVGFIFFGVGAGIGGGGLWEGLFGGKEGGGSSNFTKQVSAAEKRVHAHPAEAEAWAKLVDAQLHQASQGEYYDPTTQQYTSAGKTLLVKVADSWNHYMALGPPKPDPRLGQLMFSTVFSEEGLNQPASEVQILQQVVIPAKPPSAALYGQLAKYAYQSSNPRVGDLASQKAVSLSPPSERIRVKQALQAIKKNPTGSSSSQPSTAVTTSTTK